MSYALQNQIKAMQTQINELLTRVMVLEEVQRAFEAAQRPQRPVLTLKKPEKASNVQG